eukprot:COSAG01_NODE_3186_length_6441_cov_145.702460_3_plen_64_part_00
MVHVVQGDLARLEQQRLGRCCLRVAEDCLLSQRQIGWVVDGIVLVEFLFAVAGRAKGTKGSKS